MKSKSYSVMLEFISKHLGQILSFIIPSFLYIYLSTQHNIMPYGNITLFSTDDSTHMLSILHSIHSMVHKGNSSLLYNVGSNITLGDILPIIGIKPLLLLLLPLSENDFLKMIPLMISVSIGFSGSFMYLYLTHRIEERHVAALHTSSLLFSLAYALSSYMLIQSTHLFYEDTAVLFPLLFMYYEKWKKGLTSPKKLSVILACYLISQFQLALPTIFVILFHFILFHKSEERSPARMMTSFLSVAFSSILLSSFVIVPGINSLLHLYPFFPPFSDEILLESPIDVLSQLFSASDASYFFTSQYGVNLSVVSLSLILCVIYQVSGLSSVKERLKIFCFSLFLLSFCIFRPILSMLFLFRMEDLFFNPLCFLIPFFIIRSASTCLDNIDTVSIFSCLAGASLTILLFLLCLRFSSRINGYANMMISLIIMLTVSAYIILYKRRSISLKTFLGIIVLSSAVELLYTTDKTISYSTAEEPSVKQQIETMDNSLTFRNLYNPLNISDAASPDSNDPIMSFFVNDTFLLPGGYKELQSADSDMIDRINQRASALGCAKELLHIYDPSPSISSAENAMITNYDNGIIQLYFPENKTSDTHVFILSISEHPEGDLYLSFGQNLYYLGHLSRNEKIKRFFSVSDEELSGRTYSTAFRIAVLDVESLKILSKHLSTMNIKNKHFSMFKTVITYHANTPGDIMLPYSYRNNIKIKIDEKKVNTKSVFNDRIIIPTDSGSHTILLYYDIIPLTVGVIISLLSLVMILFHKHHPLCSQWIHTQNKTV